MEGNHLLKMFRLDIFGDTWKKIFFSEDERREIFITI